eukprot:16428288-Heterocapsa_arctica.AAC.1
MAICAIHIVPEWTDAFKKAFISRVREAIPDIGAAFSFLGGDLNFPAVGEGRLNIRTGIRSYSSEAVASHSENTFDDMTEIAADKHTRFQTRDGEIETISRID